MQTKNNYDTIAPINFNDDSIDAIRYCMDDILTTQGYIQTITMPLIDIRSMIKSVIFNDPATIILWVDGTKTVVKRSDDDDWDPEKGFCMAVIKKICGKTSFIKNYTRESLYSQDDMDAVQDGITKSIDALSRAIKKVSLKGGK